MEHKDTKILVFGVFDMLHPGHRYFLEEAKKLGETLMVVVTKDSVVLEQKKREPSRSQIERLSDVLSLSCVDEAYLGDSKPNTYQILQKLTFDIVALGHDQWDVARTKEVLKNFGKENVEVVQIAAFHPEKYKTSLVRDTITK